MNAQELYRAGKLTEALRALTAEVRDNPTSASARTFLFELLCFAGEYERAQKHLAVLAQGGQQSELGAIAYRACLVAEQSRAAMFAAKEYPAVDGGAESKPLSGAINGRPFHSFTDADPRIGPRLEVFAAGQYLWISFEHIVSVEMEAPRRLRDLLWRPAAILTGPSFREKDLGEVMLPVLCPLSSKFPDDTVRLGRATEWQEEEGNSVVPFGQKLFLVDDEVVFPFLEIRKLEFTSPEPAN